MSKPNATDNFTHPTDISSYLWNGDFSIKTDGTYGKVLAVHTFKEMLSADGSLSIR